MTNQVRESDVGYKTTSMGGQSLEGDVGWLANGGGSTEMGSHRKSDAHPGRGSEKYDQGWSDSRLGKKSIGFMPTRNVYQ